MFNNNKKKTNRNFPQILGKRYSSRYRRLSEYQDDKTGKEPLHVTL
jgi:hypothetical protein